MIRKRVRKEIDRAVKEIWLTDICREYGQGRFLVEADIQCSFYHHLRQRLDPLFAANSLYAFTEFYVPGLGRRGQKIDLAVFEMDMSLPGPWRDRRRHRAEIRRRGRVDYLRLPKAAGLHGSFRAEVPVLFWRNRSSARGPFELVGRKEPLGRGLPYGAERRIPGRGNVL